MLHENLGFPSAENQAVFDETNKRISQIRDKFYGKTSAVVSVDRSKLTEEGRQLRQRVGAATVPTIGNIVDKIGSTANVSRLASLLDKVARLRKPGRQQVLPFEEAQQVVHAIYEHDLANRERTPYWTDESFAVVDEVTKYFIGDPSGSIPLSKCLYVYGAVGAGKTYLFRVMSILCNIVPIPDMQFGQVSTKRLLRAIADAQSLKPLAKVEKGNWLIDDLAAEKKHVKIYAEAEDVIDELLNSGYESYIETGRKTHFTSNRPPNQLETTYGTRNHDRICEWQEAIFLPGESLRIDPNLIDEDDED